MESVGVKKLNSGHIMRPLTFFQGVSRAASKIKGYLYSFSHKDKPLPCGYNTLGEKLSTSRSTLSRTVAAMKKGEEFKVSRVGGKCSEYTYTGKTRKADEFFVRTECFFYTEIFVIDGKTCFLTDVQVDLLSLIYTGNGSKKGYYEGSVAGMAKQLGISYYTASREVAKLLRAELIYRPKKGVNDHDKSRFCVNMKRLRKLDKKHNPNKYKKKALPKEVEDINARAEHKRYYALRKEKAQNAVDRAKAKANELPRFRELAAELGQMEIQLAKAEIFAPITLPDLEARKKALLAEREQVLRSIGLTSADLEPKYRCQKCQDTGFLPNGKACRCWQRDEGGGT